MEFNDWSVLWYVLTNTKVEYPNNPTNLNNTRNVLQSYRWINYQSVSLLQLPNNILDTICYTPMRKWEKHLVGRRDRVLLVWGYQHQLRIIAGRIAVIIRRKHLDSQ
jgi:hypothetical protein